MKSKPPNINHSERHLTQLNMTEVCLEKKLSKLRGSCVVEKFANAAENDEWRRLNSFSCSLLSRITFQMK